jgi:hypothetical protein
MLTFKHIAAYLNGGRIQKMRTPMKCFDACLLETAFPCFGKWIRKTSFEAYQGWPVNLDVARDAFLLHATFPIDNFSRSDQHFFGIASPQPTGAAKRARIYNRHFPTSGSTACSCRGTSFSGSDHNQIKRFLHDIESLSLDKASIHAVTRFGANPEQK